MKLQEYIIKFEDSQTAFARKINIHLRYLNGIVKGYYIPSRKLATKIEQYSHGKVKAQELMFPKSVKSDLSLDKLVEAILDKNALNSKSID